MQERRNSSALAMELRLSCTDPSKWVAMIWTDDELPVLKFTKWPPGWHALFMIAPCHFRSSSCCVLYDNIKPTTFIDTACCRGGRAVAMTCLLIFRPLFCCIYFRKHEIVIAFSINSQHWDGIGSWKPSSWKRRTCLFGVVNTMVVDDLATEGARASATMVLTSFAWNFPVSTPGVGATNAILG